MSESDLTTVQIDNGELLYCKELERYINPLSKKYQEKSFIKQSVDIIE
jgi:hypothetical protein